MEPITPLKNVDCSPSDPPITPTANLNLLVAAATKCASERDHPHSSTSHTPFTNELFDPSDVCDDNQGRKKKSLSLICKKFLRIVEDDVGVGREFSLETMVTALGTNRRRIYDIINVLESLEMIVKQSKNWYIWLGRDCLLGTLAKLKAMAKDDPDFECVYDEDYSPSHSTPPLPVAGDDSASSRWDKSLGVLCQKFVMLFLVIPSHEVTLECAGNMLMPEPVEPAAAKSKVRRLYDIANVLTTLELICKKMFLAPNHRKMPGYLWCGPSPEDVSALSVTRKSEFTFPFCPTKPYLSATPLSRQPSFGKCRPFLHQYEVAGFPYQNITYKVKGQLEKVKGQPEKPRSAPSSPVRRVKQENSFKRSLSFGGGANPQRAGGSSTHRGPVTPIKDAPVRTDVMCEIREFEQEMMKHAHKYPNVIPVFREFVKRYFSTIGTMIGNGIYRPQATPTKTTPTFVTPSSTIAAAQLSPTTDSDRIIRLLIEPSSVLTPTLDGVVPHTPTLDRVTSSTPNRLTYHTPTLDAYEAQVNTSFPVKPAKQLPVTTSYPKQTVVVPPISCVTTPTFPCPQEVSARNKQLTTTLLNSLAPISATNKAALMQKLVPNITAQNLVPNSDSSILKPKLVTPTLDGLTSHTPSLDIGDKQDALLAQAFPVKPTKQLPVFGYSKQVVAPPTLPRPQEVSARNKQLTTTLLNSLAPISATGKAALMQKLIPNITTPKLVPNITTQKRVPNSDSSILKPKLVTSKLNPSTTSTVQKPILTSASNIVKVEPISDSSIFFLRPSSVPLCQQTLPPSNSAATTASTLLATPPPIISSNSRATTASTLLASRIMKCLQPNPMQLINAMLLPQINSLVKASLAQQQQKQQQQQQQQKQQQAKGRNVTDAKKPTVGSTLFKLNQPESKGIVIGGRSYCTNRVPLAPLQINAPVNSSSNEMEAPPAKRIKIEEI